MCSARSLVVVDCVFRVVVDASGVAMIVARVWQTDDTPDLSTTLKEIDRRLATAEEWGRTLRVLDSDPLHDGPMGADPANPEDPLDGNPGGRYQ